MTQYAKALRRYGSFSLAGSIDQPGIRLYEDSGGSIAHTNIRLAGCTVSVALGDPLAPQDAWPGLVRRFINHSSAVVFLNAGEQLSSILLREGFFIDSLGWEALIDLEGYDFVGQKKQNIRNAVRRIDRLGYLVEEIDLNSGDWFGVDRISQEWLGRKGEGRPENGLLTRPLLRRNRHQRVFGLRGNDGELEHIVTIDEMWRDGEVIGYHSNINRGSDTSPKNADYAVNAHIIRTLQKEGISEYSLGLCPDLGWKPLGRKGNLYVALILDAARNFGSGIYNLDGISAHKAEFRPTRKRPVYIATQDPWPVTSAAAILRALNLT